MTTPAQTLPRWRHEMRLVVLGLVLGFGLTASAGNSDSPESVVRRFLAMAYEGQFDRTVASQAIGLDRFEQHVRNLTRVRCLRAESIGLSLAAEENEQATVHAEVAISKSDPLNSQTWSVDMIPLRFELAREAERWRITEVRNRDEELAEQLQLASEQERERLLCHHPERVSKGLARALYARAMVQLNSGKFKDAANASEIARQIAIKAGDRGGEALALGASSYTPSPDDPDGPTRLTKEGLAIAKTVGDADVLARAWYDRGRSLRGNRFHPGASTRASEEIECYRIAMRLAERAEDPSVLIRILYSLANIAANSQSDYLTARRYADDGIAIAREAGDAAGEAGLEMVLSTIYFEQGDHERGLFHHTRATELAERGHLLMYPTLLVRSGCALVGEGRFDEARAAFARILTRNETGLALRVGSAPASVLGRALRCLALIETESGNLSEAECLNREAANHHGGSPNVYLFELAPSCSRSGNDRAALAFSLASLAESGLYAHQRVVALVEAGRAQRSLGNVESGLALALEAIEIREAIDLRVAGDEQQRAYASSTTSECYELAAELALDQGEAVQALAFLERGRARILTDVIDNGRPGAMAAADAVLHQRQVELDRDVARISNELEHARSAGNDPAVASLGEALNDARAIRASFVDGVRARSERQQVTRRQLDSAALLQLATRLPSNAVALEYIVGERDLHVFVISRDALGAPRVIVRTQPVGRTAVDQRVNAFLEMLSGNDLRVEVAGRDVYELLIRPIEDEISDADVLLVVPDEALWRVPFAALIDGRGQFLVERQAIVYAPSMTAYAAIIDSRKARPSEPVSLFAVGNPTVDLAARRTAASFYRGATFGPLPDAEREVDAVGALYDPRHSLVLTRDQPTESRTKAGLREATIAHFATHAVLDDANPMYSRLMLAHDGQAQDDGWLEGWEVARLDLNADLIVLSACETARGRVGGGEGVVGLAWSFFLAGASSTVATQWKVASDSTARFMIAFHQSLRAPAENPELHKAKALREAQLRLIRDQRSRHPFHWASFVLLGDPSSGRDR